MPEGGIQQKDPGEILTFEEIIKIVQYSVSTGIDKIRITGGEPLVRRNLPELLHLLSAVPGIKDLSLTTNGVLLQKFTKKIKQAGLKRINISVDTLDSQKFREITRSGDLGDVIEGIDAAISQGFFIKLNVVIMRGVNDNEILEFTRFARDKGVILRFIEFMPMLNNYRSIEKLYISCDQIKERLEVLGELKPVSIELGNGPAEYYNIGGTGVVGFISPMSCKFCSSCNRLRLTADGLLMPCLVSNHKIDLKEPLRDNREKELIGLIRGAACLKPEGHNLGLFCPDQYAMSQIGG